MSKLDLGLLLYNFTPIVDLQEGRMRFAELPSVRVLCPLPVSPVPWINPLPANSAFGSPERGRVALCSDLLH